MSECRWNCPQDLNALAHLGTDAWESSDGHTQRGFALAEFRDSYGQPCSVQQSSNVEPHLWVGVDCCRMHLTPEQARGLAERLLAFAVAEGAMSQMSDGRLSAYEERVIRQWPRERIKPRTIARCLDSLLADLDALRAERDKAQALAASLSEDWHRMQKQLAHLTKT